MKVSEINLSLSDEVLEVLSGHLTGFDVEDLLDLEAFQTGASVSEVRSWWSESVQELGHLTPQERRSVLQDYAPVRPNIVDEVEITLLSKVQAAKGEPRRSVAIISSVNPSDGEDYRFIIKD